MRWDVLAGAVVGAYLVPQVMPYAQLAGVSPAAGCGPPSWRWPATRYWGSPRVLSAGPDASTALMTAVTVAPLAAGDTHRYLALASALALADLLSKPILAGYLAGVGAIMIVGQLGSISAIPAEGGSVPLQLRSFAHAVGHAH